MSPNERFEIEAAVFYRMFGMLAPGKDDSSLLHDYGDRMQTWEAFKTVYGKAVNGTIDAMLGIEAKPPLNSERLIHETRRRISRNASEIFAKSRP